MAVIIPIQADDTQFQSAMSALKGSVEKSSADIVRAIEGMSKKSTKAVDGLSEAEKKAAAQAKEAAKGFEDLGDAAGLPVDKVKKLSEGMKAALSSMSSAQLGLVAFGGAAVAAAAAATIAVGATVAFVDGVVNLTQSAAKALPNLDALGKAMGKKLISDEDAERIKYANAAIDAVGSSASLAGAALASKLAPAVQDVSTYIVAVNLALADFINANGQIIDVLVQVGLAIADNLMAPIKGFILVLGGMLSKAADLAETLDSDLADSLRNVGNELLLFGATDITDNIDSMTMALGEYIPQAEKMITAQKKVNTALKETKELTEDEFIAGVNKAIEDTGDLFSTTELAAQEANAAIDDIIVAVNGVGDAADATTAKMSRFGSSVANVTVNAIGAVQGGLESIATLIGGPVAGAIAGLIMNLGDTVDSLISQIASIPDILTSIPQLAVKLVQAIVDAIPAIVAAIPILVDGLIDAIPTIITSLIVGLIAAIPSLIETAIHLFITLLLAQSGWLAVTIVIELVKALAVELPKVFADLGRWLAQSWKRFVSGDLARDFADLFRIPVQDAIELAKNAILKLKEGVQTFFQYWLDVWKEILTLGMANTSLDGGGSKAWDATKEVFTLGLADTKSYGDSPGVMRVGPGGQSFRASAGDDVLIGRNPADLLRKAMDNLGAPAASAPQMAPVLVLSNSQRQFDELGYRLQRAHGRSSDIAVRSTKNARGR